MPKRKNIHAVALGRKGGLVKSEKKTKAARRNAVISAYKRAQRKLQISVDSDQAVR